MLFAADVGKVTEFTVYCVKLNVPKPKSRAVFAKPSLLVAQGFGHLTMGLGWVCEKAAFLVNILNLIPL